MKLPTKNQWLQFFKILTKKEKISFFVLLSFLLISASFIFNNFYLNHTKIVPTDGGEYTEGLIGSPRFINPIYASLSDVDRDLTEIIFSGLMKYDSEGKIQPDLAKSYKILEEGKVYEVFLKENIFWQDGKPITTDDVIFTIQTIQNPEIKSPLRSSWLGVELESIADNGLRFKLKNGSAVFLENLTLKIIPKHVWESVSPSNFPFSTINLNPVGSGPYQLKNLFQDKDGNITSLELVKNPRYFDKKPYIPKISFKFFNSEEELIKAFRMGEIKGFSLSSIKNFPGGLDVYSFYLPRYFAVFFNLKDSKVLAEESVRKALSYATDKKEILDKVLEGYGQQVQSPILPNIFGFAEPEEIYEFNLDKAKEILEKAGFLLNENGVREKTIKKELAFQFKSNLSVGSKGDEVTELQKCLTKDSEVFPGGNITGYFGQETKAAVIKFQEKYREEILKPAGLEKGTGDVKAKTREKLNVICFEKPEEKITLKFSLVTVDQPFLKNTAQILKEQWAKAGVELEIKTLDISTLERDVLRKRDFDSLLFGKVLGLIPDPFPFWHSSQEGELGLNLSNYENKKSDSLLEEARKTLDEEKRKEDLEEFQNLLITDSPAVFLYNPSYLYFVSKEIKGIDRKLIADPSKRFEGIEEWHINTKRVWK